MHFWALCIWKSWSKLLETSRFASGENSERNLAKISQMVQISLGKLSATFYHLLNVEYAVSNRYSKSINAPQQDAPKMMEIV
jgi:hypothetical protein